VRATDAAGVLDVVERSMALFDELAAQWDASYATRAGVLAEMIARARRERA
jgi:hypothetical protein